MMDQNTGSVFASRVKLVLGALGIVVALWVLYEIRGVLAPFVLAFVLAYMLTPFVDRLEGRGLGRTVSILLIFLFTLTGLTVAGIVAGKRLTDEMIALTLQFMRQETATAEVTIDNLGETSVILGADWVKPQEPNPFALVEPNPPFEVPPGGAVTMRLRFTSPDGTRRQAALELRQSGLEEHLTLNAIGNVPAGDKILSRKGFWEEDIIWGSLVLSRNAIDFGDAGPNVVSQISALARDFELFVEGHIELDLDLAPLIRTHGRELINVMLGGTSDLLEELLAGVKAGLMLAVLVPFVAFFFLKEGRRITHGIVELVPNAYFELFLNLIHQINGQIGGYIRGQLLAVSVVATLSVIGLTLIEVPYALPVGVLAGLANMIPYLGPAIGIVAASLVALTTGGEGALVGWVVVVFLIIQLIDNVVIQPLVVAKSVDLHPLVVLIVVLIGSDQMGIVGMLIAVPVTGILKVTGLTVYKGMRAYRVR
jgi:predicted PurR-regulated permease PerM